MRWREFGNLVYSFRRMLSRRKGRRITQRALEDLCGFTDRRGIIGRIERGTWNHVEPEVLTRLADVFELHRWERRDFFLAGTGVPTEDIYRGLPNLSPRAELERLKDLVGMITIPAFILDPFGDIVVANRAVLLLYQISPDLLDAARRGEILPNMLYFVFSRRFRFLEMMDIQQPVDEVLLSLMQSFRRTSMHYRHTNYWKFLYERLRNSEDPQVARYFEQYWNLAEAMPSIDGNFGRLYKMKHPQWQDLEFVSGTIEEITHEGPLYVFLYLPLSPYTWTVFKTLSGTTSSWEENAFLVAPWPLAEKERRLIPPGWRPSFFDYDA